MEILFLFSLLLPPHSSTKQKFKFISDVLELSVSFIDSECVEQKESPLCSDITNIYLFLIIFFVPEKPYHSNYSKIYYNITSPCAISPPVYHPHGTYILNYYSITLSSKHIFAASMESTIHCGISFSLAQQFPKNSLLKRGMLIV